MRMASKHTRTAPIVGLERLMPTFDRAKEEWLADDIESEFVRRPAGARIVIAEDKPDIEPSATASPGQELTHRGVSKRFGSMEEVAERHDCSGIERLDHGVESRQVFASRSRGRGQSGGAEARGLADVHIGDEKRAIGGAPDGALR